MEYILCGRILKSSGFLFCFDHHLDSLRHTLHQMFSSIILKVIPDTDNHLLHDLQRDNMSIIL